MLSSWHGGTTHTETGSFAFFWWMCIYLGEQFTNKKETQNEEEDVHKKVKSLANVDVSFNKKSIPYISHYYLAN